MNIILKDDVENLGKIGDLVRVKPGYARNYLIPKGKAIEATVRNVKNLEHQKKLVQDRIYKTIKTAEALAKRIESTSITLSQKVGENERLFGSVTTMTIATALQEEGIDIDKKKILLEEPIKQLGVYTIPIKLHPELTADLKVWVVEET
jgi:large subunit ribosomal protein L9